MATQNLGAAAKEVLSGKLIAIQSYLKKWTNKQKSNRQTNLTAKKLKKEGKKIAERNKSYKSEQK